MVALEAHETSDPIKMREIALQALRMNTLSVNAWCLLGSLEPSGSDEQIDLYRRAVSVAMALTGAQTFDYGATSPAHRDTKPVVKALIGLAEALCARGDINDAIGIYDEALRLDPFDGYRVRYRLAKCLMTGGYLARLQKLVSDFEADRTATWCWTRAFSAFKLDRGSEQANDCLELALDSNPYIGPYLLRRLDRHDLSSPPLQLAEEDEAARYIRQFAENWDSRPEAKAWLAERCRLA